jgi:phospholipid/cholesterol/gamma-HCH transport system permease protein
LISFLALIVGSIIVLQTTAQLSLIGSQEMMGNILVVTIMRELGPLLTALIVIARSGSAVASELGNMQVNNEFESLRAMSIEPLSYVFFPRIMGGVISLVSLAFYFNVIAFLGGFIIAHYLSDLSFEFYLDVISNAITFQDFSQNIIKNAACGLIIFSIATYHGLKVKNAAFEVPIASTKSVVNSIIAVMVFNLLMTLYHLRGGII